MKFSGILLTPLKSGRWKAYVYGQPSSHISNWNGCNYRYAAIDGQPHLGFDSSEAASAWVLGRFSSRLDAMRWANHNTADGSFLTDERFGRSQCVSFPPNEASAPAHPKTGSNVESGQNYRSGRSPAGSPLSRILSSPAPVLLGTITLEATGVTLRGILCPTCKAPIDQSWNWHIQMPPGKTLRALCPKCEKDCRVEFTMTATVISVTPIGSEVVAKKGRRS